MFDFRRLFLSVGAPILGAIGSMWLVFTIIEADRNVLAQLMQYLGYAGLILGIFWPRAGFFFLIGISGYLDFFKRLLILAGDVNWNEIIDVLKVAPLTLLGVFVGLVLKRWIEGRFFSRPEWIVFLVVSFMGLTSLGLAYKETHNLFAAVATTVNGSVYLILLLLIPMLFRTSDEIVSIIQCLQWYFIPVAIYGMTQFFFGLNQFEIEYLKSGYTMTYKELFQEQLRPFSTLNSEHGFSIVMATLFILSFTLFLISIKRKNSNMEVIKNAFFCSLYLFAVTFSLVRTAWLMLIMGAILSLLYRGPKSTFILYVLIISSFFSVIIFSKEIYDFLPTIQSMIPLKSAKENQAFSILTYSERLKSLHNLKSNPQFWTLFGNSSLQSEERRFGSEDFIVHDAISQGLIRWGVMGFGFFLISGSLILFQIHKRIYSSETESIKTLGCGLVACIVSNLVTGSLSGSHLHIFPINLFFWMIFGFLISIFISQPLKKYEKLP